MRPHGRLTRVPGRIERARRDLLFSIAEDVTSGLAPISPTLLPLPDPTPSTSTSAFQPNLQIPTLNSGIGAGSTATPLATASAPDFGDTSATFTVPTTSSPAPSSTDIWEPSTTQAAPITADDTQFTPIASTQTTFSHDPTTVETSTSVVPVTSVISISGTAATTTVWLSPLASAKSAQDESAASQGGGASTGTIVAVAIACAVALILSVVGYRLWHKKRRARRNDEKPMPYSTEYPFSPIEDPFKLRSPTSPISLGCTKRPTTPLPAHITTREQDQFSLHPDAPEPAISSRPSSTFSYINSLCPETAALFPEPPATHPAPYSRPQTPQSPTTARSYMSARTQPGTVGFRPLPMPVQLSPLMAAHFAAHPEDRSTWAAHFANPEERASVWSVMEVEDARGTIYDAYAFSGGEVLEIGSPPEYSRE
ncbi:uncharacterized protein TRAVEDRAFT_53999 [Trametes versicolor FP-101664 SS1]|uniref:Uncharacterized protein n=1 Tax=Trametes versicolor (strain FP-101664) TaxID=717944 RepID=R7S7I8_TRAVS|nr:uncharacterized protein TRAVEDRAFT_53999 [Trametes versicolor FP-101664 SS1]EIW52018.1 hypothetical protein TRAVEDRAFT_53999 [Trametes versicolor FP-101664 SS1]